MTPKPNDISLYLFILINNPNTMHKSIIRDMINPGKNAWAEKMQSYHNTVRMLVADKDSIMILLLTLQQMLLPVIAQAVSIPKATKNTIKSSTNDQSESAPLGSRIQ